MIRSDLAELDRVFRFTADFCRHNRVPELAAGRLLLVVEELIVNVIEHGARARPDNRIEIALSGEEGSVTLSLEDDAPLFNPLADAKAPGIDFPLEERAIGGLGLYLVTKLAKQLEYTSVDDLNRLRVVVSTLEGD